MTVTTTDFDVLIVGAGISGIGAAYQLKTRRPNTTFAVLEARESIGGTWDLFRYPGIRSDSDMQTFGYGFKPWTHEKSIADAHVILDYLREIVAENGLEEHIRFGYRVVSAEFSSVSGRWTISAQHTLTAQTTQFTARFFFSGTGYYDHAAGYTPDFAGVDEFEGRVVHPQHWPEDLDYTGKRVVVIGSGATAVTLIPAMAGKAAHVTMLQRSPGYVLSTPGRDPIANALNKLIGHDRAYPIVRRKNLAVHRGIYKASRRAPKLMRRLLIANVRRQLPKGYDVATHFTPNYKPWDQRLCMVPNGDLFKAISSGDASVVTDRIVRFAKTGILLESGAHLEADVVITATGLNMLPFGAIELAVDGRTVNPADTTAFKAMMMTDVPNFVFALGYTNISWTLKVDLVCEHFCRLLDHMDAHGYSTVVPAFEDTAIERIPVLDLTSGYVQRGVSQFPRAGTTGPWTVAQSYEQDVERLRNGAVEDSALVFGTVRPALQPA